jgi:hypothetical protein
MWSSLGLGKMGPDKNYQINAEYCERKVDSMLDNQWTRWSLSLLE